MIGGAATTTWSDTVESTSSSIEAPEQEDESWVVRSFY